MHVHIYCTRLHFRFWREAVIGDITSLAYYLRSQVIDVVSRYSLYCALKIDLASCLAPNLFCSAAPVNFKSGHANISTAT